MRRFTITDTPLAGLKIIQRKPLGDERGSLTRLFCAAELNEIGFIKPIMQINHTVTKTSGTVRGMHYQKPPCCEMKLVNCLKGKVFDIAVDVRQESPTFLQWYGTIISKENNLALLIPEGFAHGFQTLTNNVEMLYFHSALYNEKFETGLHPQDPAIGIQWPATITNLSTRDKNHFFINDEYKGVNL